jgi:ketosteroid isomerase-like protein
MSILTRPERRSGTRRYSIEDAAMNEERAVREVLDRYRHAVLAKDVDSFVALYDVDVRIFDTWGAWSYRGIDAWRRVVAEWFGSLGSERVEVVFSDVESFVAPTLAVLHAFVRYRAVRPDGSPFRALDNRISMALRPIGGAWKIVHEHTSAPIDAAKTTPILQR